ncbi:hypothetical protein Droror1_Dr00019424 [Drosera rotundifolia]
MTIKPHAKYIHASSALPHPSSKIILQFPSTTAYKQEQYNSYVYRIASSSTRQFHNPNHTHHIPQPFTIIHGFSREVFVEVTFPIVISNTHRRVASSHVAIEELSGRIRPHRACRTVGGRRCCCSSSSRCWWSIRVVRCNEGGERLGFRILVATTREVTGLVVGLGSFLQTAGGVGETVVPDYGRTKVGISSPWKGRVAGEVNDGGWWRTVVEFVGKAMMKARRLVKTSTPPSSTSSHSPSLSLSPSRATIITNYSIKYLHHFVTIIHLVPHHSLSTITNNPSSLSSSSRQHHHHNPIAITISGHHANPSPPRLLITGEKLQEQRALHLSNPLCSSPPSLPTSSPRPPPSPLHHHHPTSHRTLPLILPTTPPPPSPGLRDTTPVTPSSPLVFARSNTTKNLSDARRSPRTSLELL